MELLLIEIKDKNDSKFTFLLRFFVLKNTTKNITVYYQAIYISITYKLYL